MGNKFRLTSLVESRRLLWPIAVLFTVFFSVQYFELLYGYAILALFSSGEAEIASVGNFSIGNSSSRFFVGKSLVDGHLTLSNSLNYRVSRTSYEISNVTELSDGKDGKEKYSDDSSDLVADIDPKNGSPPSKDFIKLNHNLAEAEAGRNHSRPTEKAWEYHETVPASDDTSRNSSSLDSNEGQQSIAPTMVGNETVDTSLSNPSDIIPWSDSPPPFRPPAGMGINSASHLCSNPNASSMGKNASNGFLKTDLAP